MKAMQEFFETEIIAIACLKIVHTVCRVYSRNAKRLWIGRSQNKRCTQFLTIQRQGYTWSCMHLTRVVFHRSHITHPNKQGDQIWPRYPRIRNALAAKWKSYDFHHHSRFNSFSNDECHVIFYFQNTLLFCNSSLYFYIIISDQELLSEK